MLKNKKLLVSILISLAIIGHGVGSVKAENVAPVPTNNRFENSVSIDSINEDFIGNTTTVSGQGGGIYNTGIITSIVGDFINNYVTSDGGQTEGGAIYNAGTINTISGNFIGNYTYVDRSTTNTTSFGGAIANVKTSPTSVGQINEIINSSFYNNHTFTSTSSNGIGGAIYTASDLKITADGANPFNNGTSIFKGNYSQTQVIQIGQVTRTEDNAIYVDLGTNSHQYVTLTLNAVNNGKIYMYDSINGFNYWGNGAYNVHLTGDNSGYLYLYNDIKNGNVITDNITINTINNQIKNYEFFTLTSNENSNYEIDIDFTGDTPLADTFTTGYRSSGKIQISNLNYIGKIKDYSVQILLADSNDDIQLTIADTIDKAIKQTIKGIDKVSPNVRWTQQFNNYEQTNNVLTDLTLSTTRTLNDTLNCQIINIEEGEKIPTTSLGDTLALVNQLETDEDRSFNFDTADDRYIVSQDLGQTSTGTLSVNGVSSTTNPQGKRNLSEVNLNGHNGFELVNNSSLNVNNINLTGNNTLMTVNNPSVTVNIQNSNLDGNISTENNYTLNINGSNTDKTVINGSIGNANATLNGSTLEFKPDTFKDASLTAKNGTVNLVTGEIDNYQINSLNSDSSAKYGFDIDVSEEEVSADKISVGSGSTGTITVSEVNFVNGGNPDKEFTVQLLNSSDDNIQVAVDENLTGKETTLGTTSKVISTDTVVPTVKWNDKFNKQTQSGTVTGTIDVATTNTTNDSISLDIADTVWGDVETSSMGDTLALVNQLETEEDRNFNFDSGEDVYGLDSDLGTTASRTININGKLSETGSSTINGNNHNMFVLSNPTNLNLNNVKVTGANTVATGTNKEAVINLNNVNIQNNKSGITTAGSVNISGNSRFENNGNGIEVTSDDSVITLNGLDGDGEITINDRLRGVRGSKLNLKAGVVNLEKTVSGLDVNMDNSTTNLASDNLLNGLNMTVNSVSNVNMMNNSVGTMHLNSLTLNDNMNLGVDVDLANKSMDRVTANSYDLGDNKINVNHMTLLSDAKEVKTNVQFADDGLKNNVTTSVSEVAYSPIYKYGVNYDKNNGEFQFTRSFAGGGSGGTPSYQDLNPSVMVAPVAAQLGGYTGMIDTYNNAFNNMDIRMLQPSSFRQAQNTANRYAIAHGNRPYLQTENNSAGIWARPYTAYDSVRLKRGPKVHTMSYGTFIGGDSGIHDFGNGFQGVFSAHASYQGSHQSFAGNSIYQNGANLGFTGTLYKGNFFTGLTAATGVSLADASTLFGDEDFPMLTTGVASKTGYNIEFKDGKFIIQPSLLLSYTFVNAFNYTNAAGIKIDSQPLHAIQIAPNIRFSLNTKNHWQPYLTFGVNWNIMNNQSNFLASETALPNLSIKPYFQYGLGVQKLFNDNFTGFAQVALRNGGRNGIAATAGMRYLFDYNTNHSPTHTIKNGNQL